MQPQLDSSGGSLPGLAGSVGRGSSTNNNNNHDKDDAEEVKKDGNMSLPSIEQRTGEVNPSGAASKREVFRDGHADYEDEELLERARLCASRNSTPGVLCRPRLTASPLMTLCACSSLCRSRFRSNSIAIVAGSSEPAEARLSGSAVVSHALASARRCAGPLSPPMRLPSFGRLATIHGSCSENHSMNNGSIADGRGRKLRSVASLAGYICIGPCDGGMIE